MNIILLGSGGREHALAVKIIQSKKVQKLFVIPGNAGTSKIAENVKINLSDFEKIADFALDNNVEMIVVGPEAPLAEGICNFFELHERTSKIKMIGPDKTAAQLESSKGFSKIFMQKYSIPTARYLIVKHENLQEGIEFINQLNPPFVLKADGLAAGKGVLILDNPVQAKDELVEMLEGKFGQASQTVVIEEFLDGIELSVFVITDGKNYKLLPSAKDYKRIGEGDTGLNTGGMGAVSPVPFADEKFMEKVENQIIKPTIAGLISENITYKGFIFFGLIKVKDSPFVIEYNVRMGDPETEVVIPLIESDIVELFEGVANGNINEKDIKISNKTSATVMLVSEGYPGDYPKGIEIDIPEMTDCQVFHAGTGMVENKVVTNGGRVISVTGIGDNIQEALQKAYSGAVKINFKGKYYRKDIGKDLFS